MKLYWILPAALSVVLTACGGSKTSNSQMQSSQAASQPAAQQPAAQAAPDTDASSAPMTTPDWFHYDKASNTVQMTITAGLTAAVNHWNYNGGHNGDMIITVPEGAKVTLDFKNADPAMAHTLGIVAKVGGYSATPTAPPVFEGAITTPHSSAAGIDPGKSQTLHFTASKAGNYAMVCYMAGHAAVGMWIHFNVSTDGTAGVQSVAG
jgi:sulfocyanin